MAIYHYRAGTGVCLTLVSLGAVCAMLGPNAFAKNPGLWIALTICPVALVAGYLLVGCGLWRCRNWARVSAIVFTVPKLLLVPVESYWVAEFSTS